MPGTLVLSTFHRSLARFVLLQPFRNYLYYAIIPVLLIIASVACGVRQVQAEYI